TFGPVAFDPALCALLRSKAQARQLSTRDMVAAAGHDSVVVAAVCPSAMLFVPSVDGITHNPKEYSTKEHLARGAQVLLDAVLTLARGPNDRSGGRVKHERAVRLGFRFDDPIRLLRS